MMLTAIGTYGFLTGVHLRHRVTAQEAVDRDAAPLEVAQA
jgi:NifB/MoaA-like Fe-S oxidoreductase